MAAVKPRSPLAAAVVVGTLLSAVPGNTQVPERREATVDFVYFTGTPKTESARGGTAPATMRVEPNRSNSAAVGVIEEFAGGSGAQWRSTA